MTKPNWSTRLRLKALQPETGCQPWIGLESVGHALEFIRSLNQSNKKRQSPSLLFRGASSSTWKLEPSLARAWNKYHDLDPGTARSKERETLRSDLRKKEKQLVDKFKASAQDWMTTLAPRNDWEWLAVAQHHHIPTRMLDWTSNALIGLWFATEHRSIENEAVFWVLETRENDWLPDVGRSKPYSIATTKIFNPGRLIPRIHMQSGVFTVHKLVKNGENGSISYDFIPLDRQRRYQGRLHKILIPESTRKILRDELEHTLNLTAGRIYPDRLDKVAAETVQSVLTP